MIKNTLASVLGIATTFVLVLFMIAMIKNKPVSVPKTTIVELDLESFRLPEPEPPKVITDKRPLPEKP